MGLQDMLNEFSNSNANSDADNGVENPFTKLKHQPLRLQKRTPEFVLRLLPPAGLRGSMFSEAKEFWTPVRTKNGTKNRQFIMSAQSDPADPMEGYISFLNKQNIKNSFGGEQKARSVYYMNVVPYKFNQQTRNLEMMVTPEGKPDVYVLQLNWGQMHDITELLKDPMNNPNSNPTLLAQAGLNPSQEEAGWSFVSSQIGYAVKMIREDTKPVKYSAQLLSQYPLAPLPQGWESSLEDIQSLTMPTYKISPGFVEYAVKQGSAENASAPAQQPAPQTNIQASATQAMPWETQSPVSQQPATPVAPQAQPQGMPWDTQGSTVQAPVNSVPSNPSQVQNQVPQAPANASPLAGLGTPISQNKPVTPKAPDNNTDDGNDLNLDEETKNMLDNLGIN